MIYSYLKITFRNFIADGMYTTIIVFGLGVGIAVSLIIAMPLLVLSGGSARDHQQHHSITHNQ